MPVSAQSFHIQKTTTTVKGRDVPNILGIIQVAFTMYLATQLPGPQ